jgi:hypothetical protein
MYVVFLGNVPQGDIIGKKANDISLFPDITRQFMQVLPKSEHYPEKILDNKVVSLPKAPQ